MWEPLGCRYDQRFELSQNQSCYNTSRRILFTGDSQLRTNWDVIDRRLSGSTLPVDKIIKLGDRLNVYHPSLQNEPWSEDQVAPQHSPGMAETLQIKFAWDPYLDSYINYHNSPYYAATHASGLDLWLDQYDSIVFETGHWLAAYVLQFFPYPFLQLITHQYIVDVCILQRQVFGRSFYNIAVYLVPRASHRHSS
jgi:hypothetical protein